MKYIYELTKNTKTIKISDRDIKLYQIRLLDDCKMGFKGTFGGWIEKYENLSGFAWVGENAY